MLQKEIRPKLSLEPFSSLRVEESPIPIAMIKGTVIGPVVTPPESNATAIKSAGAAKDRRNTAPYRMHKSNGRLSLKRILRTAMTRNKPTPTATVQIKTLFGIEGT